MKPKEVSRPPAATRSKMHLVAKREKEGRRERKKERKKERMDETEKRIIGTFARKGRKKEIAVRHLHARARANGCS